jgi:hypothetical protein
MRAGFGGEVGKARALVPSTSTRTVPSGSLSNCRTLAMTPVS